MPAMIGRTLRSAVTCGLLLSLGACEEAPYPLTRVLAEQGSAEAQFSLGVFYDTGQGVVSPRIPRRPCGGIASLPTRDMPRGSATLE